MNGGRRSVERLFLGCLLQLLSCAAPLSRLTRERALDTPAGVFRLHLPTGSQEFEGLLEPSLRAAAPELARWGALRSTVDIWVLPTHQRLEDAAARPNDPLLRAWARYDEVLLQAPASWAPRPATPADLTELMVHELTHCLMFQLSGTQERWSDGQIPFWFREGMASITAHQGYRRMTLEALAQFYDAHPGVDPVTRPDPLDPAREDVLYSAAHHAFTFLLRRYGDRAPTAVLQTMGQGLAFAPAFERTLHLSAESFAEDFVRYVRLRGFRGGRGRL